MQISDIVEMRGIDQWVLDWAKIRVDEDTSEVIIPYPNVSGVWYERMYRPYGSGPKYQSPIGADNHLYNPALTGSKQVDVLWIAEGEWDTLTLVMLDCDAVGIAGANMWNEVWPYLFSRVRRTVVATDPDDAGDTWFLKYGNRFPHPVRLKFPAEVEDVNDWWMKDSSGLIATIEKYNTVNRQVRR